MPPPILTPTCDIQIANPHYAYGLMRTPRFDIHDDFDAVFDDQAVGKSGCYIDRNARVLLAQPRPWIQDTRFVANGGEWQIDTPGGPKSPWHDDIVDPYTGKRLLVMDDATPDKVFGVFNTNAFSAQYGYYVKISRGLPPAAATHDADNVYWVYTLGLDANSGFGLRIVALYGKPFRLDGTLNGGAGWDQLAFSADVDDCEAYLEANNRTIFLTILPFPEQKTWSIYLNSDIDLSCSDSQLKFPNMAPRFDGKNGKAGIALYPMVFPIEYSVESATKIIGFVPLSKPRAYVWPDGKVNSPKYPDGCRVDITVGPGPVPTTAVYTVTGSNPPDPDYGNNWASVCPRLQYAQVEWPPVVYNDVVDDWARLNPRHIIERHIFNWNDLSVTRAATIVCDNHRGRWNTDFDSGYNRVGVRAVSISRGWNGYNQIGMLGWLGETIDYDRMDPKMEVTFNAFDRSFPLQRRKCGVLPPMDGWCIYAALRFMAGIGGVTEDWLQLLPNCPTGPAPINCDHYLLPMGSGYRPRMQPAKTDPLWSYMIRVANLDHLVMGFEPNGQLAAIPFFPPGQPFFGYFSEVPQVDPNTGAPILNEIIHHFRGRVSRADVRSRVALIGIDPTNWQPLVEINDSREEGIVFDSHDPAFLGFYDPWVDVDPVYTNQVFMKDLAARMVEQVSQPVVNEEFGAWLQPGLDVMMQIAVREGNIMGNVWRDLYSTGLLHKYAIEGGQITSGTTDVQCKAIRNF